METLLDPLVIVPTLGIGLGIVTKSSIITQLSAVGLGVLNIGKITDYIFKRILEEGTNIEIPPLNFEWMSHHNWDFNWATNVEESLPPGAREIWGWINGEHHTFPGTGAEGARKYNALNKRGEPTHYRYSNNEIITFIKFAYNFLLGREADEKGYNYYVTLLQNNHPAFKIFESLRFSEEGVVYFNSFNSDELGNWKAGHVKLYVETIWKIFLHREISTNDLGRYMDYTLVDHEPIWYQLQRVEWSSERKKNAFNSYAAIPW